MTISIASTIAAGSTLNFDFSGAFGDVTAAGVTETIDWAPNALTP